MGMGDETIFPILSFIGDSFYQRVWTLRENNPYTGSFSIYCIPAFTGKPRKSSLFSTRGKNAHINPDCQNTAGNPLTGWLPKALKSRHFSPPNLAHTDPEKAAGMRI
jgi:hypothetical protein